MHGSREVSSFSEASGNPERTIYMSIVIIGGNERMVCQYTDICKDYGYKAKVFPKENGAIRKKIGCPDLMVLLPIQCPIKWSSVHPRKQRKQHSGSAHPYQQRKRLKVCIG